MGEVPAECQHEPMNVPGGRYMPGEYPAFGLATGMRPGGWHQNQCCSKCGMVRVVVTEEDSLFVDAGP